MKNKMVAAFAIVLVASITVGATYALWEKTVYINGTVMTGEVNAEVNNVAWDDIGIDPGFLIDGVTPKDKDVGSCTAERDPTDPQILIITIENGYPCYECTVTFDIVNTGTIPIKVQTITVTNPTPAKVTVTPTLPALGTQIEGLDDSLPGSIYIHVEQPADELATYTFTVSIQLVQWNEYTP